MALLRVSWAAIQPANDVGVLVISKRLLSRRSISARHALDTVFPLCGLCCVCQGASKAVCSCLSEDKRGMKRAMLEVVAAGAVSSPHDVLRYINCTLLAATTDFKDVVAISTRKALEWLSKEEFIRWGHGNGMSGVLGFILHLL